MITLRPVDPKTDTQFLYDLLAERPPEACISHKEMPSYQEHELFVKTFGFHYEAWYIVEAAFYESPNSDILPAPKFPIGSIYITRHDEVCVHVKPGYKRRGFEREAIRELMASHPRNRYFFNVAPNNQSAHKFYQDEMGLKVIQWTYVKEMP